MPAVSPSLGCQGCESTDSVWGKLTSENAGVYSSPACPPGSSTYLLVSPQLAKIGMKTIAVPLPSPLPP